MISVPRPTDPLACPVCNGIDQSQTVESILSYGIGGQGVERVAPALLQALTFNQSEFDHASEHDYDNALASANHRVRLAQLAPAEVQPKRKAIDRSEARTGGCIWAVVWILFLGWAAGAILAAIFLAIVGDPHLDFPAHTTAEWAGDGILIAIWIGGGIFFWLRPSFLPTLESQEVAEARAAEETRAAGARAANEVNAAKEALSEVAANAKQRKERARRLMSSLYYCSRDNVVYLPRSKSSVKPGPEIYPYLLGEAKQS